MGQKTGCTGCLYNWCVKLW